MAKKLVDFMKENRLSLLVILTLTLFIAGWFYWFQWRPAEIRKYCHPRAAKAAKELFKTQVELSPGEPSDENMARIEAGMFRKDHYDDYYRDCLHENGLE